MSKCEGNVYWVTANVHCKIIRYWNKVLILFRREEKSRTTEMISWRIFKLKNVSNLFLYLSTGFFPTCILFWNSCYLHPNRYLKDFINRFWANVSFLYPLKTVFVNVGFKWFNETSESISEKFNNSDDKIVKFEKAKWILV